MHRVLIFGAGKIGSLVSVLLANSGDYAVTLADVQFDSPHLQAITKKNPHLQFLKLDAADTTSIANFLRKNPMQSLVSCLPFYRNIPLSRLAKEFNLNYFDPTEDRETASAEAILAKKAASAFVPQCGLAPGFISIVANDIMRKFSELDTVKLRVGALPINSSNALQYSLTWSTEGLINEYANPCQVIENGEMITLPALDDLEEIKIDGLTYEAFNTSGGIGTLVNSYASRVKQLNYKTIRYPGHCEKIKFLMHDLKLNQEREILKRILENALPRTIQDVVLVYVSVSGKQNKIFVEENYVKKFYAKSIQDISWSAIQLATASALSAVLDLVVAHPEKYKGLIRQEEFTLQEIIHNRFGKYFV